MATATVTTISDVRAWARENGIEVGLRGRLSAEVIDQFNSGTNKSRGGLSKYVAD